MFAPVVMRFRTYEVAAADLEREYMEAMLNLAAVKEWLAAAAAEKETIAAEERG